jgi:methenyltetrahydromethanopterin cyclohydrolase
LFDSIPITELQLLALLHKGAAPRVALLPAGDKGWKVRVNDYQILRSQREPVRYFARSDTALRYLKELGVLQVTVDLVRWPQV